VGWRSRFTPLVAGAVILVDSSAWIELLRATGSPVHERVRQCLKDDVELATTEVVIMELLAGARSDAAARALRSRLLALPLLRVEGLADYEDAAELWRSCRRVGTTLRGMADCLIAAVALRNDVPILHHDMDFEILADVSGLQLEPVS
jgi:predicted nucleic acid-binding protein